MKALAIIPARYQSTRFPGKPLALLGDKPMLRHVYENVTNSALFEKVVIASDDERILEAARSWNAEAIFTATYHPSGTDRCAEAAEKVSGNFDVIVNIQGDEPFISREPLEVLLQIFENEPNAGIATLVQKINDPAEIDDPNTAKVVLGTIDQITNHKSPISKALYFSRSPIPFIRSADKNIWLNYHIFWKHIGLYAFKPQILEEVVKLPPSLLEKAESLEQLRWLENGFNIYAAETKYGMLSVDTPADLEKAEKFLKKNNGL